MSYNIVYMMICQLSAILVASLSLLGFVHYRSTPYARPFSFLMAFSGIYLFMYSFELLGHTPEWVFMWIRVEYLGIPMIGVCWFWFAWVYCGLNGHAKFKSFLFIQFGIAVAFILMVWTNPWHQLYYKSVSIDTEGLFPVADLQVGILYYAHFLWEFMLFVAAAMAFWIHYKKTSPLYKYQSKLMGALSILLLMGVCIDIAPIVPFNTAIDMGPLMITFFSIIGATIIYRTNLLKLSPIARERVFESMEEGVIVTTEDGIISDMNAQIKTIIPAISKQWIGQSVFDLEPRLLRYNHAHLNNEQEPLIQRVDDIEHVYEVRKVAINNTSGAMLGYAWYLRHITEEHHFLETMIHYAEKDTLTGVWNRRKWIDLARREVYRATRYKQDLTVMIIDIDFFKRVNDSLGHAAGDHVLEQVTDIISNNIRQCDIFGRLGGEEFVLLFPDTNRNEAQHLSKRILQSVEQQSFEYADKSIHITISGGIASNQSGNIDSLDTLLEEADKGLYEAKNNGRNQVVVVV